MEEKPSEPSRENELVSDEGQDDQEELSESITELKDIVDRLPREAQKDVLTMIKGESFSGPLPHPDHLKGYAEVLPEAPQQIINMAIKQQSHRHEMEVKEMDLEKETRRKILKHNSSGMYLGFAFITFCLILGYLLIIKDKDAIGLSMLITAIIPVIGKLLFNNKQNKQSDERDKADE